MAVSVFPGSAKGKTVESVIIPMVRGPQKSRRYTLCVSSQAGCAMNCGFCHTGERARCCRHDPVLCLPGSVRLTCRGEQTMPGFTISQ